MRALQARRCFLAPSGGKSVADGVCFFGFVVGVSSSNTLSGKAAGMVNLSDFTVSRKSMMVQFREREKHSILVPQRFNVVFFLGMVGCGGVGQDFIRFIGLVFDSEVLPRRFFTKKRAFKVEFGST